MARTDDEVISVLRRIYRSNFGSKLNARYLISWEDLRALYGLTKLYQTRFERMAELAVDAGFYIIDLGTGENGRLIAVIKIRTVDRWRKVPRRIIDEHRVAVLPVNEDDEDDD